MKELASNEIEKVYGGLMTINTSSIELTPQKTYNLPVGDYWGSVDGGSESVGTFYGGSWDSDPILRYISV